MAIKKYLKDESILLIVGRVKDVYQPGTYKRSDGTTVRYRNLIAIFPTEEGDYKTYKVSAPASKINQFDKFKPGDLIIIRFPKDLESNFKVIDEEKRRIFLGITGSALKGGKIHEEYYNIPKLEEIPRSGPRKINTLKEILDDIERNKDKVKKNWYTIIGHIYRIHSVYPYISKNGEHKLAIRLGIEDYSGAYMRGITFAYDLLLEDVGLTVEDIENKKDTANEETNVNKELAKYFSRVEGKYYIMVIKVDYDQRFNEYIAKIVRFEKPDIETIKTVGGDE